MCYAQHLTDTSPEVTCRCRVPTTFSSPDKRPTFKIKIISYFLSMYFVWTFREHLEYSRDTLGQLQETLWTPRVFFLGRTHVSWKCFLQEHLAE